MRFHVGVIYIRIFQIKCKDITRREPWGKGGGLGLLCTCQYWKLFPISLHVSLDTF